MRRILQGMGAEVIHLGHNRSVDEVVTAALQEDAQGIAVSYQGGHVEYFSTWSTCCANAAAHIQVFGGGGGVIVPARSRAAGLRRGTHLQPEDGQRMGLAGHDRRDGDALRRRPVAARADLADAPPGPWRAGLARTGATDHRAGQRQAERI